MRFITKSRGILNTRTGIFEGDGNYRAAVFPKSCKRIEKFLLIFISFIAQGEETPKKKKFKFLHKSDREISRRFN